MSESLIRNKVDWCQRVSLTRAQVADSEVLQRTNEINDVHRQHSGAAQYARAQLTLPSDLTDAEWTLLEPFFPPPSHAGHRRKWPLPRIVEAILYLLRGGLPTSSATSCRKPLFIAYYKAHDLITSPTYVVIKAADRFHTPTTCPNETWQTDFTYVKIIGWGWMYRSTVLDDFSRYSIAWKLCSTMRAEDVTDTLDLAPVASGCASARTPARWGWLCCARCLHRGF